jgi:hypothetical protein
MSISGWHLDAKGTGVFMQEDFVVNDSVENSSIVSLILWRGYFGFGHAKDYTGREETVCCFV